MVFKKTRPKESPVQLLVSLLLTVGLLAILRVVFSPFLPLLPSSPQPNLLARHFSAGERQLIGAVTTLAKQEGTTAFAAGDYRKAVEEFEKSLRMTPNDPETLIYLNNARLKIAGLKTYTIATSVPIGKTPNVAQEILRGVAQAQDEINRNGGINGVGLVVEIMDDENNPTVASQIATVLVNQQNVLAVVGHNTSDTSLEAAPIYQRQGLVMISPTTFDPAVSKVGSYIFRAVPTAQSMSATLVKYLTKHLSQPVKMLVCYDSSAPDNAVFRDAFVDTLAANGGEVINVVNAQGKGLCDFASDAFDPDKAIASAINQGANSLYLGPSINYLDPAIEVAKANAGRLPLFSSPSLYTQKITRDGKQAVEGLVLVAPWSPEAYPDFANRAHMLWRATVNWRTATTYDATRAIIAGLWQDGTRQGLQQALQRSDFSTPGSGGVVRFLDTRDRRLTPVLIQIKPDNVGGYRFAALTSTPLASTQ
jgi:branched-chain amino acid transport system substrate-binding protein